jgi:hypothetical protein
MSNPKTFYTVGGLDLSSIFQPLGSLSASAKTNYKISGGLDLNTIFANISTGSSIGYNTNYIVKNYNDISGNNLDLRNIFAAYKPYTTNGIVSSTNPFVTSAPSNGYTYILFNSSSTNSFNILTGTIPILYYMIVGLGCNGRIGALSAITGGVAGGAGGIWNDFVNNFPVANYNVTIPNVSSLLNTTFTNSTSPSAFSLIAQSGQEAYRGAVDMSLNSINYSKSPSSNIAGEFGVGGQAGEYNGGENGGGVFLNSGNIGNFLTFLGDNLLSNTLFGGGGGGGSNYEATNQNGGSGGGGGGGGATYGVGGTGVNGFTGGGGGGVGGVGGSSFTASTTTKGYGGGGGGGGKSSNNQGAAGGIGGPAMLLLYFQYP